MLAPGPVQAQFTENANLETTPGDAAAGLPARPHRIWDTRQRHGAAARRRAATAAHTVETRGACARGFAPGETVWRLRLFAGTSLASGRRAYWIAPLCAVCLPGRSESRWATILPRPCESCGHGVVDCCRSRWRRISACYERCQRRAWNRRRLYQAARSVASRAAGISGPHGPTPGIALGDGATALGAPPRGTEVSSTFMLSCVHGPCVSSKLICRS